MNIRLKPVDCIAFDECRPGGTCSRLVCGAGGGWAFAHDIDDFSRDVGRDATAINAFVGYNYNENLGQSSGYLHR